MDKDKRAEFFRYENRGQKQLSESVGPPEKPTLGSSGIEIHLRGPYLRYEACIRRHVTNGGKTLELGSGTGRHSHALFEACGHVVVSDISFSSLRLLVRKYGRSAIACVADMESLPFKLDYFDFVTCAGSLSYGGPNKVDAEVQRVLKRGGTFICVDSLNHNPVYRLNRWIHCLLGNRTASTLRNMPSLDRIQAISHGFSESETWFFGSISYLSPVVGRLVGQNCFSRISNWIDKTLRVRKSAFKFVLLAKGNI